jgi:hypothetical protein
MTSTVSDILKQLDNISNEEGISIFVPSLKKNIKFKALNLKQQKELLKTSIDENLVKVSFNILLNSIIAENIIDAVDTNNFFTFDRSAIAVALRAKSLDNIFVQNEKSVDLNDFLSKYTEIEFSNSDLLTEISDNNITISLKAPSLLLDKEINTYSLNKMKSSNNSDVQTIIGDLVVYEFIKFISAVRVQEKEITFNTLPIKEKITITEKLPSNITNKVFNFIKNYRDLESKFTKHDDTSIDIDGSFFTI